MPAADERLKLLFERVERLEEESKGIRDDIRDTFAEAKALGYDVKIMKLVLKRRKMKPDDKREMEMLIETYEAATTFEATPLGQAMADAA